MTALSPEHVEVNEAQCTVQNMVIIHYRIRSNKINCYIVKIIVTVWYEAKFNQWSFVAVVIIFDICCQ